MVVVQFYAVGGEGCRGVRAHFGLFDEEVGLFSLDEGVGDGDRVVGDVVTADVVEPCDFVEGREYDIVAMVSVQEAADFGQLVCDGFSGIFVAQAGERSEG